MQGGILPEPSIEELEVEEHEDMANRGHQPRHEAMPLLRRLEFHQRLNGLLDFLQAPGDILAEQIRILFEGFRDHLPVEEEMDPPFADLEQRFGVHGCGLHFPCRPRRLPS